MSCINTIWIQATGRFIDKYALDSEVKSMELLLVTGILN